MRDIHFCERINRKYWRTNRRTDIEFHDHQTQISIDSIYKKTTVFSVQEWIAATKLNQGKKHTLFRCRSIDCFKIWDIDSRQHNFALSQFRFHFVCQNTHFPYFIQNSRGEILIKWAFVKWTECIYSSMHKMNFIFASHNR